MHPFFGAGEKNIEAAPAFVAVDRAETLIDATAGLLRAVGHGNQDDVALIPLDVFQVFDEYRRGFGFVFVYFLQQGIVFQHLLEAGGDFFLLRIVHGDDAQAFFGVLSQYIGSFFHDGSGFFFIVLLVEAAVYFLVADAQFRRCGLRRGEEDQF